MTRAVSRIALCVSMLVVLGPPLAAQGAQPTVDIELLINRNRIAEARTALAAFSARTRADTARALYFQGRIALVAGTTPDAVRALEKSVALAPNDGTSHFWLAIGYIRTALAKNRVQQAFYARRVRTTLERSVALSPRLVDARAYLMQYYLRAPYLAGGSKEKARAQADTIRQIEPLRGHMALAQMAESAGDHRTAEREFAAMVTSTPKDDIGYNALGGYYRRRRSYTKAVEVFDRLRRMQPEQAFPHLQIGRTLAESGQELDRARAELELAITMGLVPIDAAMAHYQLGTILQRRGEGAKAREHFDRAIALDPTITQAIAARRAAQ